MRTLAIDLGSKRIGLAMSDQGGQFASPLPMIEVTDPQQAIDPICQLIKEEAVEQLVLGLPLNMDDTLGPQAKKVIDWSKKLFSACGLALIFIDERLSSFEAEQKLLSIKKSGAKITRKDKKQSIDSLAACGFLQGFLDGTLKPINLESL